MLSLAHSRPTLFSKKHLLLDLSSKEKKPKNNLPSPPTLFIAMDANKWTAKTQAAVSAAQVRARGREKERFASIEKATSSLFDDV